MGGRHEDRIVNEEIQDGGCVPVEGPQNGRLASLITLLDRSERLKKLLTVRGSPGGELDKRGIAGP
jgi:hypothetical protein